MLLSVGTYLESLVVALGARGAGARVGWVTGADARADARVAGLAPDGLEPIAALVVEGTIAGPLRARAETRRALLGQRRTHRGPFASEPLGDRVIRSLRDATSIAFPAEPERTAALMIVDPAVRRATARLLRARGAIDFLHPAAWKETYRHIRFRSDSEDGLPIDTLLARRVSAPWRRALSVLLSPAVMRVAGPLGLAQSMATEASRAVAAAPLLIYLSFRDEAPSVDAQVQAGARLQAVWLQAAAHGVALHPFSVLVQHDDLRAELARCLNVDSGRGFFFARAGRPLTDAPRAPRRAKSRERVRII
jgi:hypothetical protein